MWWLHLVAATGELAASCQGPGRAAGEERRGRLGQTSKVIFKNQDNRSCHVENDGKKGTMSWDGSMRFGTVLRFVFTHASPPPALSLTTTVPHYPFAPFSTWFSFHRLSLFNCSLPPHC